MTMLAEALSAQGPEPDFELRAHLADVERLPADRLYLEIGEAATSFLMQARDTVADGKLLVDVMLEHGITDIESFAQSGYGNGLTAEEMLFDLVGGEVKPYTAERERLMAQPGESMFDFALYRLRPHQEVKIKIGEDEYNVRLTCDGRYDPELYPLDMGSVAAGLDETKDVLKLQDMVDVVTLHTLHNGIPFNGMRVKSRTSENPFDEHNYFASRGQTPTYFDMLRRLGKHGGEAIYMHEPYVKAMEQIWQHFNPGQEMLMSQPADKAYAFRRGGITEEGLPFSVYGDDRNNGRRPEDYIGREESLHEDEHTAVQAAMMVEPSKRAQQYADTKVHLRAAGECGWDMSLSRYGDGESLSSINTTNVASLELQLMLIDGGRMLAHSYTLLANQAKASGDEALAQDYADKKDYITEHTNRRVEFVETYCFDEETGTYHDVVFEEPSASYDSLREYTGFHRVKTVTAATGHVLRTLAHNGRPERLLSTAQAAKRELFGPGGVAATNVKTNEQWDGEQGWAYNNLIWIEGVVESAASIAAEYPEAAEELLAMAEDRVKATLYGSQQSFDEIHMVAETNNTHQPGAMPVEGEYPKDPHNENSPQNFAMQAELIIFASLHRPRERFNQLLLLIAAGRKEDMALAA